MDNASEWTDGTAGDVVAGLQLSMAFYRAGVARPVTPEHRALCLAGWRELAECLASVASPLDRLELAELALAVADILAS